MDLLYAMSNEGADIYYNPDFRHVLEDHLTILREDPATEVVVIKPNEGYKYEYDLCGYLSYLNVPMYLHWITMRVNGWHKETEFYNPSVIYIPHRNSVNKIKNMYEVSVTK